MSFDLYLYCDVINTKLHHFKFEYMYYGRSKFSFYTEKIQLRKTYRKEVLGNSYLSTISLCNNNIFYS